jgi:ubiquinone biosynthesis protein
MLKPLQFIRLIQINLVLAQRTFNRAVLGKRAPWLRTLSYLNPFSFYRQGKTRGESIRLALEELGPIFVKFGQMLSTRRDLLPPDIIKELSKLQDQVPAFPGEQAKQIIEKSFNKSVVQIYAKFDTDALASASIAQVHAANLFDGTEVIVKVLRPKIKNIIKRDIGILFAVAKLTEKLSRSARRLHAVGLVAEFERTILNELDLMREAANATQLKRNFADSDIMYVPQIYWDYTKHNVMTMERIYGIPIADVDTLKKSNTDMKELAERGVTIFFTQVFRDSFFHADMHPGNLFVDISNPATPKYIGVDFGIMGSLSPEDQRYLAANFVAFFNRDYRQVAVLHIESGWVKPDTRVDHFEAAIRTVCEPIFERPLKDISFGQLLLRLFQTAEHFDMEVQPQLMLLQKTLLSIEGLGRQLYPDLDLWQTAKPFLEDWMKKQRGMLNITKKNLKELPEVSEKIWQTPSLLYEWLHRINFNARRVEAQQIDQSLTRQSRKKSFLYGAGVALLLSVVIAMIGRHDVSLALWQDLIIGAGGLCLLLGWILPR